MEYNNNWDLFAVVKGCLMTSTAGLSIIDNPSKAKVEDFDGEISKEAVLNFSDMIPDVQPSTSFQYELDELYKPFYDVVENQQQLPLGEHLPSNVTEHDSYKLSKSLAFSTEDPATIQLQQVAPIHRPQSRRSRRKKKPQQKKVVWQIPVDAAENKTQHHDLWAWRKYGQKPIKGSPYPRGYYRCSSSKLCQARKQVERSIENPGILVITYTAEHNHPVPTHRSSLAGSTRRRKTSPPACDQPFTTNNNSSPSESSTGGYSLDQMLSSLSNSSPSSLVSNTLLTDYSSIIT